ncbi:MAG: hypothetical protein K0Q72_977 [Armatimonadetes bacterium]|nr:hypothetical protein [Armatimonadota bacterium]
MTREIDYLHELDGVLYQGTFARDAGGRWTASWNYVVGGRTVRRSEVIDVERFEYLWQTVREGAAFRRSPVQRSFDGTDPVRHHLVSLYTEQDGDTAQTVYQIPAEERDGEFCAWLLELNGPWM